jgi:hypothetical protein
LVPKAGAAILDRIGEDLNADRTNGNAFLLMTGGNIRLDTLHLKNIVLKDVHVFYSGGPVILENVYFVNSTFDIDNNPNSQLLTAKLIEPSPTNYSLSS